MEEKRTIAKELDHVLAEMEGMNPGTKEYLLAARNAEVLAKAMSYSNRHVSADVVFKGIVTIGGLLIILNFEKLNIISTKALGPILSGLYQ